MMRLKIKLSTFDKKMMGMTPQNSKTNAIAYNVYGANNHLNSIKWNGKKD